MQLMHSAFMGGDSSTRHGRLQIARERAGYAKPADAARAMGVKAPTYFGHENGSRAFDRVASRYAKFFKVSLDWLLDNRGPAPTESHIRKKPGLISVRYVTGVRHRSQSPVQSFDPDEKPIAALHSGGRHNVPAGEIPQIAARLGLGHAADADTIQIPMGGGSIMALPVIDTWKIPESVLRRRLQGAVENVHIVECVGDSMEPRIRDGDFVFIDASAKTPHPPGIFAISETLGPTLKRLEVIERTDPVKVRVIPENPRHSTYEVMLEEITIIGRYLCRLTME